MQLCPTPVIMFSSLTTDGAKATLDALDAGALDFLPKRFEDIAKDRDEAKKLLCQRVKAIGHRTLRSAVQPTPPPPPPVTPHTAKSDAGVTPNANAIHLVAIGTSTGGPIALQKVLTSLPANFPAPILLVQHMPASFTPAFAQRLDGLCKITVKEAADGDVLKPGVAYLAPGGKQMMLTGRAQSPVLKVSDGEPSLTYKPSVDVTFRSISKVFPSDTLAIVLTGMGADGREGARMLKQGGSTIWAQDEASSVIYGMPGAIAEAKLADRILSLDDVGPGIVQRV